MTGRVTITIPGRPSRWMRPGQDPRGFRYTDPKAEAGKRAIAWEAKRAYGLRRPALGPVILRVVAIFDIPKSWPPKLQAAAREARVMHVADPDLDQLCKNVLDALKGIAFVDDNQVVGLANCAKRYGAPERTEITIEELTQAEDEKTPGQRRLERRVATDGWDAVLAPPARRGKATKSISHGSADGDLIDQVRAGTAKGRFGRVSGRRGGK